MAKTILISGRRYMGKSTLALNLAHKSSAGIAIFDPNNEFDVGCVLYDPHEVIEAIEDGNKIVVLKPKDVPQGFTDFSECLWGRKNFSLIIDESHYLQNSKWVHHWLDLWVRLRKKSWNVNLLLTYHRPQDSAMICRSLATDWYLFQNIDIASLSVIEETCGLQVAEKTKTLGDYEFVHWSFDRQNFEINQDPRSWFIPKERQSSHVVSELRQ